MTITSFCLGTLYLKVIWILPSLNSPADDVMLGCLCIKCGGIAHTGSGAVSRIINSSTGSIVHGFVWSGLADAKLLFTVLRIESFDGCLFNGLSGTE